MSEGRATSSRPRGSKSIEAKAANVSASSDRSLLLFDLVLIGFFLGLGFLLGVFRLKDVDFYWHLRTGDLIRTWREIPRVDFYTFTRAGSPWIDLHWIFQVCISWIHERGGVPALTFAKCVVTCAALLLLITARRKHWPIWAMILAWLPALLVLSGRMYIRPETLTLLYLAIFLAVLIRWDRHPTLAWILPITQLLWVNSHGLFVLGPIVLAFALIDAALRRGALSPERRKWWTQIVPASAATALACLFNPYGIHGALYPLELASTMNSPRFTQTIAELKPITDFIRESGWGNVPMQIHFVTIGLGALSFLIPIAASASARLRPPKNGGEDAPMPKRKKGKDSAKPSKKGRGKKTAPATEMDDGVWRISLFRLLLFAAFSLLSFRATRNSHQFAAVVGSVTAWNFGEWIASRRGSSEAVAAEPGPTSGLRPRIAALTTLILLTFAVGSGALYAWMGEGRVIGWGEEPLWFPHEAAEFAGGPGTPDRCVTFHNGHASLYIYRHSPEKPGGPGKTVYTDPRLEVTGLDLYTRYLDLKERLSKGEPAGMAELDRQGRPSVLVDHEYNTEVGAGVLADSRWRCVWFDAISAVMVHESYRQVVQEHEVDFGERHFHPSAEDEPRGVPALISSSKAARNYSYFLGRAGRSDLGRQFAWLALDYARKLLATDPESLEGWKSLGATELIRDPAPPAARCRVPFEPTFDLAAMRATYGLQRALAIAPNDFLSLDLLQKAYQARDMAEPQRAILARVARQSPINLLQQAAIADALQQIGEIDRRLASPVPTSWKNLDELDRAVAEELRLGRIETAVRLLESAYPPGKADWNIVQRLSTLLLHLGEPERARRHLQAAVDVPAPALRDARLAVCALVEGRLDEARGLYLRAIDADPRLFEARYGLAVLEQDDARADAALEQAAAAADCAPSDAARGSAQALAAAVRRYAQPVRSGDAER